MTCYPGVHSLNATAVALWGTVRGQWRFSFSGAQGLDLAAVEAALRLHNVPEEDRLQVAGQLLRMGEVIVVETQRSQAGKSSQKNNRSQ